VVVDVVNGTGDPTVAQDVTARLQAAGMTIGSVTTSTAATASAIEHTAAGATAADQLAAAVGARGYLRVADVAHLTVVLAGSDAAKLQAAIDTVDCAG
jgi:hypothetical protein